MKFTNAELTARMIFDQKNGWPFCPRCGKPLKIDPQTQRAASSNALSREVSGLYICDDCVCGPAPTAGRVGADKPNQ